jgi:NitT/TauT family transport system permease protein
MFAAIVIIMIVALVAEQMMTMVEHRLAKWRPAPLQETN